MQGVAVLLCTDGVWGEREVSIAGICSGVLKVLQVHPQFVLLLQSQEVDILKTWMEGQRGKCSVDILQNPSPPAPWDLGTV